MRIIRKEDFTRITIAVSSLLLTGGLMLLAQKANTWFFSFYPKLSASIEGVLAEITGVFPFSVFELLCLAGIVAAVVNLVLAIKRRRFMKWVTSIFMTSCLLLFGFTFTWGLNHFAPPIVTEKLGYEIRPFSVDELEAATKYFRDKAGEAAEKLPQNEDGTTAMSSFRSLALEANDGYKTLVSQGFEIFKGSDAPPKPLASGVLFSYTGTTGIYIFLTGESNVNPDAYPAAIPFTMCHELAHRRGIAHEDEANFCAFLACNASKNPEFNYSGFYDAFIYCHNALYKVSPERAMAMWEDASPRLYADIVATNRHYSKYDGKVQEAAQSVNDSYLKAFGDSDGVQSYGAVADALIAWYLSL